jgi:hypothetical protein
MKVLIVDQFFGPSPFYVMQKRPTLDELVAISESMVMKAVPLVRKPVVKDVPDDFSPDMCTTVYAADKDGIAFMWKYRWDSNG